MNLASVSCRKRRGRPCSTRLVEVGDALASDAPPGRLSQQHASGARRDTIIRFRVENKKNGRPRGPEIALYDGPGIALQILNFVHEYTGFHEKLSFFSVDIFRVMGHTIICMDFDSSQP